MTHSRILFSLALALTVFSTGFWAGQNYAPAHTPETHPTLSSDNLAATAIAQPGHSLSCPPEKQEKTSQAPASAAEVPAATGHCEAELARVLAEQTLIEDERKARQFSRIFQKENALMEFTSALSEKFIEQPIDTPWAKETEANYLQVLRMQPKLSGVNLMSFECKTSLCKLSLEGLDTDTSNRVAEVLSEHITKEHSKKDFVVKANVEQGVTEFYIGKDHKSLEFN